MKKKKSSYLFLIKSKTLFKHILFRLRYNALPEIHTPDDQNYLAKYFVNYRYNCKNPRTFNEYIGWLKFNYFDPLWCKCADKLQCKQFLNDIGFGDYVPKTLAVFDSPSAINIDNLPDQFVLKANDDSGTVFKCYKKTTDFSKVLSKIQEASKEKYSNNGEWVYSGIKNTVFAEEMLVDNDHSDLIDYKFFVYNGIYRWGFCAVNRSTDCNFFVFEDDFVIQNVNYSYIGYKKNKPVRPKCFDKMINVVEAIGKYFKFVRVDLYVVDNKIKIGELTFFSMSGLGPFTKKKYDFKYGSFFKNIFSR